MRKKPAPQTEPAPDRPATLQEVADCAASLTLSGEPSPKFCAFLQASGCLSSLPPVSDWMLWDDHRKRPYPNPSRLMQLSASRDLQTAGIASLLHHIWDYTAAKVLPTKDLFEAIAFAPTGPFAATLRCWLKSPFTV